MTIAKFLLIINIILSLIRHYLLVAALGVLSEYREREKQKIDTQYIVLYYIFFTTYCL